MTVLCASPRCQARDRHRGDCHDEQCRGCLPRRAADGLRLCHVCSERLATNAITAGQLWHALGRALTGTTGWGEKASGTRSHGLSVNDAAVEARATIRHTLVAISKMISETRGFALPADNIDALADYLARNAAWLAAHETAGDLADELADLAHGDARRIAYPSGARRYQLRTPDGHPVACPTDGCDGALWAILRRDDSLLPSELVCSTDDTHRIPASQWLRMGRHLIKHAEQQQGGAA